MKELQHYDKAAHNFYARQTIVNLPLTTWDIFSKHFQKVCSDLNDLSILKNISKQQAWETHFHLDKEMLQKDHVIVVTDSQLNIVHATKNIFDMNGYRPNEIIGQKPKIFQGEQTDRQTTDLISEAVKYERPFETIILNYRKDGSTYNCWIKGAPIRNRKGKVVNFIAFEREVA